MSPPADTVWKTYSVFLAYYLHSDVFAGGDPTTFALVGGLSVSLGDFYGSSIWRIDAANSEIALLVSPVATICIRVYGTRVTIAVGVLFET